jgi:serine/threonine-protein kinase
MVLGALVLVAGAAYAGWRQFLQPRPVGPSEVPSGVVDAGAAPSASVDTSRPVAPVATTGLPWRPQLAEAQGAIATGDFKAAQKLLKEAFDKGGHGVPRTFMEHVNVAAAAAATKQSCHMRGLARPRTYDLKSATAKILGGSRPAIALGPRGPVMTWTDAHEGAEHAYAVLLDDAMRSVSDPFDVTPEGQAIGRPELAPAGDKLVLTYWDAKGPEAGVKVRFVDADGRIAGPATSVMPVRGGNFWPSLSRLPDGSFWVMWSTEEGNSEDLFIRELSPKLEALGAEPLRASDLMPVGANKPRARLPATAVQSDALLAAFRLERDPVRLIHLMRVPLADLKNGGLPTPPKNAPRVDRFLGEAPLVNTDKEKSDQPGLACGAGGCFVVWQGEPGVGGASAAFIEPGRATALWRRKFTKVGADPAIAIAASGEAQIVWFERNAVLTAKITRDGVGNPSRIARISGDQPMPSIAPGAKAGEWLIAWLDFEAGHLEPYGARVACK